MKCEFKEIEKRIYDLEIKLKIVDPKSSEKWERLKLYAFSRALQEKPEEITNELELPDYLKFAEEVYNGLVIKYIEYFRRQERWRKEDEEYREKQRQYRERAKQRKLEELKEKEKLKEEKSNSHPERSEGSLIIEKDSSVAPLPQNDKFCPPEPPLSHPVPQCHPVLDTGSVQDTTVIPPKKSILFPHRINWDAYG